MRMRAGTPITVMLSGTSVNTRLLAATTTFEPILAPPMTLAPAPK